MALSSSPQPMAEGEPVLKSTYAAQIISKTPTQPMPKTQLKSIQLVHGEPTLQFTFKELDEFATEEGLHQAIVMKFSYGAPAIQELRRILPKQFAIKGQCLIGLLATRHILIRCDQYEDFVSVLSHQSGYIQFNGENYGYRTFPWTISFNRKEETSRAVAWLSLPGLPTSLFARKSLLSIASAAGRPFAIDKATQVRSRPSTARVKVELDLLDKHPKRIKLQYLDEETGKILEHFQEIVYDSLPLYCTNLKHQGHDETNCRLILNKNVGHDQDVVTEEGIAPDIEKYKGDARKFLNEKRGLAEVSQRADDKNPLTCTKNNVLAIAESSKSDDVMHTNYSPILVQKTPQAQADLNCGLLVEKAPDKDAQGGVEVQNNPVSATKTVGNQIFPAEDVHIGIATGGIIPNGKEKASVCLEIEHESGKALENIGARVGKTIDEHSSEDSVQHGSKDWNMLSPEKAADTSTSRGQKCVTCEDQWANMVDKEDEQATPQRKLSPEAPAFVPKGSSIAYVSSPFHRGQQLILTGSNVKKDFVSDKELIDALVSSNVENLTCITPTNTNKQVQVGGSSTFSPNRFANLQEEDIFEEDDEEDLLDHCFESVARDADISPRQQRNNKKKHGRKNSWDGKVTGEFVPKHLPMRQAKQNHTTVSTKSTRSTNAEKK